MLTVKQQIETSMCSLCRIGFNLKERKPLCFMPCGHTCCQKCVDNFVEKFCPNCKKKFSQSIPDYGMIDTLNKIQSTSSSLQKSSTDLVSQIMSNFNLSISLSLSSSQEIN